MIIGVTEMSDRGNLMTVYTDSAALYDLIYGEKDYEAETAILLRLMELHAARTVETVLDVACGTGGHLITLARHFTCCGVDLSEELLAIAREKLPEVPLYQGDMTDFDLNQTFDVVTCLFSAIGYVQTVERLNRAVYMMARHVTPGGLLMVEPWLRPDEFKEGYIVMDTIDRPDIKICRASVSRITEQRSLIDMHHLVATRDEGVRHFTEMHDMGLFSHEMYIEALRSAGLHPLYDEHGLIGRGLYMGLKGVNDLTV
jgi:ubiquinone/menaquinone biosynthesis C-methylase UbiE